MLKEAQYPCWGFGCGPQYPEFHKAVYVIISGCCYFSGTERGTSTINAAESVIADIARREGKPIVALRWFDLQTYRGYRKCPGECKLSELSIGPTADLEPTKGGVSRFEIEGEQVMVVTQDEEDFRVTGWQKVEPCPPEVLELFKKYIGEPRSIPAGISAREARAQGFEATDLVDSELDVVVYWAEDFERSDKDFAFAVVDNEKTPGVKVEDGERYTLWQKKDAPPGLW